MSWLKYKGQVPNHKVRSRNMMSAILVMISDNLFHLSFPVPFIHIILYLYKYIFDAKIFVIVT